MKSTIYNRIGRELLKQADSAKEPIESALQQIFELLAEQLSGARLQSPWRAGYQGFDTLRDSDFLLRRQAQAKAFVSFALGGPSAYTLRDLGRIVGRGGMAVNDFEVVKRCLPSILGTRGLSLASVREVQDALQGTLSELERSSSLA